MRRGPINAEADVPFLTKRSNSGGWRCTWGWQSAVRRHCLLPSERSHVDGILVVSEKSSVAEK